MFVELYYFTCVQLYINYFYFPLKHVANSLNLSLPIILCCTLCNCDGPFGRLGIRACEEQGVPHKKSLAIIRELVLNK